MLQASASEPADRCTLRRSGLSTLTPHCLMFGTFSCLGHPHQLLRRTVCFLSVVSAHILVVIHAHDRTQLTLLSPEQTDEQDASTVDCEQRTDGIELGGEDL